MPGQGAFNINYSNIVFSLMFADFHNQFTNYALTRHATTDRLDRGHNKLRLQIFSSHDMQVCLNRHQILSKGMQIFRDDFQH